MELSLRHYVCGDNTMGKVRIRMKVKGDFSSWVCRLRNLLSPSLLSWTPHPPHPHLSVSSILLGLGSLPNQRWYYQGRCNPRAETWSTRVYTEMLLWGLTYTNVPTSDVLITNFTFLICCTFCRLGKITAPESVRLFKSVNQTTQPVECHRANVQPSKHGGYNAAVLPRIN